MYDYIPHMCLVPMEARKGAGSPGTEVQMVITTMWLLGSKPRSSAGTTRTGPLSYITPVMRQVMLLRHWTLLSNPAWFDFLISFYVSREIFVDKTKQLFFICNREIDRSYLIYSV